MYNIPFHELKKNNVRIHTKLLMEKTTNHHTISSCILCLQIKHAV